MESQQNPLGRWKTALRTILWGVVLSSFIALAIQVSDHCYVIVNGAGLLWTASGFLGFWLALFLLIDNRNRFILIGATFLVFLAFESAHVDRFPIAVEEYKALKHLRRLSLAVNSYRTGHPKEGFPTKLPPVLQADDIGSTKKLYTVEYTASRSSADGPVDRYMIQVAPVWRDCGFLHSFAVIDDGEVRFTIEPRPVSKSDEKLD